MARALAFALPPARVRVCAVALARSRE